MLLLGKSHIHKDTFFSFLNLAAFLFAVMPMDLVTTEIGEKN